MAIFLGLLLLQLGRADLPVHCYLDSAEGSWVFTMNTAVFTAGLLKPESRCGHTQPNSAEDLDSADEFSFDEYLTYEVQLTAPNVAVSQDLGEGTWTL
jgi:hypothetical protein